MSNGVSQRRGERKGKIGGVDHEAGISTEGTEDDMIQHKQHHRAVRAHAMKRRADQYRPVAGLARALVGTLAISYVALGAGPAWAASPPNVIFPEQSSKISAECTDFRNLVTVTQTVENLGGPLAAKQDKIYVTEAVQPKGGGAHLHSKPVFIPAMASGAKIRMKIPVGTTESYRGKLLPGHLHMLNVYLAANGKKAALGNVFLIEFPKGYCQPPDPKIIHESYRVDNGCKDDKRLIALDVTVRNDGGPLAGRKWSVYAFESGGTGLSSGSVWVPPLAPGAQASMTIPIGVLKSPEQLPGSHSLRIVSLNTLTGKKNITPMFTITLPKGICQLATRPTPSQMHLKTSRTLAVRPPPVVRTGHGGAAIPHPRLMPPSPRMKLTPRMRLNRSGAGAAGRNRIPGLLSHSAVRVQKKRTPSLQKKLPPSAARPKTKLSPPTMRMMRPQTR